MLLGLVTAAAFGWGRSVSASPEKPNIVLILADDMGIGDVSGLNPKGKIPTPHLDQMIKRGLTFNDAHTSSAVCTPTRYALLTGRYNWRNKRKQGVASGFSPSEIEKGRATLATMLGDAGYRTAMIGKWHLGLDWVEDETIENEFMNVQGKKTSVGAKVDFTKPFRGGPIDHGFDHFFGIAASLDMPPYVWLKDDRATEVPKTIKGFNRRGPAAESFEAVDVLPRLGDETVAFINRYAAESKGGKPFFIYVPLASPHTPIVPSAGWKGKSTLGTRYADFVMETDDLVGQVNTALRRAGLSENTLVIFTTDNGCSPSAKFHTHVQKGHQPSHIYRGHKADLYEGGHRVPTIMQWSSTVKPGTSTDQLVVQTDLFQTFAELTGQVVKDNAAEDSISFLPLLLGQSDKSERTGHIAHAIKGKLSIREGDWKLILDPGSGGWTPLGRRYRGEPGKEVNKEDLPPLGLYNITKDPGEHHNLIDQHPEIAHELIAKLKETVANGRSTPGSAQENNGKVKLNLPKGW